jgi:uncharacterized lipoprotein NlpE involved in copper resistance
MKNRPQESLLYKQLMAVGEKMASKATFFVNSFGENILELQK